MSVSELYRFTEGVLVWTYTSADEAQTHSAETYDSASISRTEPELKMELAKASITVNVGLDSVLGQRWLSAILDTPVFLTIFKMVDASVAAFWKGRLTSVKPDDAKVGLNFESALTYMQRTGLSAKFQRICPHVHYGRGCNLDMEDFAIPGTVATVAGSVVTSAVAGAHPDGQFTGGMIRSPDGVLRFIINHVGTSLTLIRPIDVVATDAIDLFPGCDRSLARCESEFDNLVNNGSFPFIPIKNPYSGTSIV